MEARVASRTERNAPDEAHPPRFSRWISSAQIFTDAGPHGFGGRRATPPCVDAITGGGTRGDERDGAVRRERAFFRRGVDRTMVREKAARTSEIIAWTRILSLTDDHLLLDSLGLFGLFLRLTHDGKVV